MKPELPIFSFELAKSHGISSPGPPLLENPKPSIRVQGIKSALEVALNVSIAGETVNDPATILR